MKKIRSFVYVLAGITLAALLTGCGGGGGGGGGGGAGGVTNPPVYTGNANAAVITETNASQLAASVFGSGDTATTSAGLSIQSANPDQTADSGPVHAARRLSRSVREIAQQASTATRIVSGLQVDFTDPCDNGMGSVRTSGVLNEPSFTGILDVFYNHCLIDGLTIHGPAKLRIDEFSFAFPQGIPSDSTLSYEKLEIRGPGVSVDEGGSLRDRLDFGTNTEIVTINVVTRNNITGKTTKDENFVIVYVYDNIFSPGSFNASLSGRLFDHDLGFVDVSTNSPLFHSSLTQQFPGSGQIVLAGSGNGRIRMTANSALLALLELDLDGNGAFERAVTLKWTDIDGPVGADLGDRDGDGMHNSWETVHGLNPDDPGDAVLDKDGDGASNFAEYQTGSDPSDPVSTPPAVGLSLTMQDTPDPALVGGMLAYSIVVSNASVAPANNVVVTDSLPATVNFVSAAPTQGNCTGMTSIVCNLGTLNAFGNASIVIQVSPTAEGLVSNTASVTTSSFDPNQADNSATATTSVGQPLAGIQGQIDIAIDGQTIEIDPGLYTGNLDFRGKNITLLSRDGPATTILHGNGGTAVRMGPAGAIKGFTITGAVASFGAGIEVVGQGSLISGNVFDGNAQGAGGFGGAIGGNSSSPTIERNIFRNNTCDNQFLSGVVAFVNGSSPSIVNNVFENNPCRAINLTLPEGNSPQVINNTFIGNRAGVRIGAFGSLATHAYRNNIIVSNEIGLEIEFSGPAVFNANWANNLVLNNTSADYQGISNQTGTNGNISADPMFINEAAGNYRLQPGSPAINAGSSIGAPIVDFDGTARPINGSWDIGAFEAP